MRRAVPSILSAENRALLDEMIIDCYVLHTSKANELAFASNNHKTREFEIKFMSDDSYRISTRFLGYKRVMERYAGSIETVKDPDGRRYSFRSFVYDEESLNSLLGKMLKEGYDPQPKIKLI